MRISEELREQYPDHPWMWRADWVDNAIKSSNRSTMLGVSAMAVLWNAISWPMAILILPAELRNGNYPALLALLFPMVGIFLAVWTVILIRRYWKYGESTFQMSSVPGVIGGSVSGVVRTQKKLVPENGFRQRLSCVELTRGSGKNGNTKRTLWQTDRVIERELVDAESESVIPVHFTIPYEVEATMWERRRSVYWQLEVRAEVAGVDYLSEFVIPVFVTEDSSTEFQPNDNAIARYARESSAATACAEAKIDRQETANGVAYSFPLFRHVGPALVTTGAAAFWWGALLIMGFGIAGEGWLSVPVMLGLGVFGVLGLLFVAAMLDLWLWKSRVEITGETFTYRAGYLGIGRRHELPRSEISAVVIKSGGQLGQEMSYDLSLSTADGARHRFGKRVVGASAAKTIAQEICDLLALAEPTVEPRKSAMRS